MEKHILSQFINNIPQFVWWKDLNSIFLGCNENLLKYVGFKDENDIVGKTDYDLFSQEEADAFTKTDKEVIASGIPQLNFEECITLPEQGKRWLSTSKVPLYDEKHKIVGTIGWFNDITALKNMQISLDVNNQALIEYSFKLEQANRDLELANIDLEKFTYATSHDLKGPIRTMVNFADLLLEKEENNLDKASLSYLEYIHHSAYRMDKLIDDILDYARTGSKELRAESIDFKELVLNKINDFEAVKSKAVSVELNLPTKKINCYPQLIGLLFSNLIQNGIKFNKSNNPSIYCAYREDDEYWVFSVEDNGMGVPAKFAKQIFEPFKRLVGEGVQGSGLGLSICKRIANLHNGDVWLAESENGHTVFKFSISKELDNPTSQN